MKTLERRLGLTAVIAISMGAMLGSGLFVLPGLAAMVTGPSLWLAYLVAGLFVVPAALSKAELSTAMPTSGGSYVFLERAFGPLTGTIGGLGLWFSLLLKSAFALVGLTWYLNEVIAVPETPTALIILAGVVALNIVGVRKVGQAQIVMVGLSMVGLVILGVWGAQSIDPAKFEPSYSHGLGGFAATVAVVTISYAGPTKVAAIAEEVQNPGRNLPLGILLSLGLIAVVYGAVNYVLAGNLSAHHDVAAGGLQGDYHPIYTLALVVAGPAVALAFALLGTLTMASMANAGVLAASRFPFAMSRDHLLPVGLANVHPNYLTPTRCIVLTGLVMAASIIFLDIASIAKLASSFKITISILINLTVVVLREGGVQWYRPTYHSPLYPYMQAAGVVVGLVLLVMLGALGLAAVIAAVIAGLVLFLAYGRTRTDRMGVFGRVGPRRALLDDTTVPLPDVDTTLHGDAAVAMPLFGHERSPETLLAVSGALADGARVEVVHLTEVPEQLRLDSMVDEDPIVNSLRRRLAAMADERNIDVTFDPVVTRDVVKTVHHVTSQMHCEWLVMEWRGSTDQGFFLFHPLGWLFDHLDCRLALFKDAGIRTIREILVLAEPGPHDALVITTADHLASLYGARVTFARFVPTGADSMTVQSESDYLDQLAELCEAPHGCQILRGASEVETVAQASGAYDLLVTGAPHETGFKARIFGTAKDQLTRKAACSVLRLRTPRTSAHQAVTRETAPDAAPPLRLWDSLEPRCLEAALPITRKDRLFGHFAASFAESLDGVSAEEIARALWERERTQNTAVGMGLALPHATVTSADRPYLGVFTSAEPLDYDAPDGKPVDVFFVTLGPPSARRAHLVLLSGVSRLVLETPLLERLRAATSRDDVFAAFFECEEQAVKDTTG